MSSSRPPRRELADPRVLAEALAAIWELFSSLLFVSAVVPAAFTTPWPAAIFLASLAASALAGPRLLAMGARGFAIAAALRLVAWPVAIVPLLGATGLRGLVAALAFGLMAAGMRRAIYRRIVDKPEREIGDAELAKSLRARLAEAATMSGIAGGHILLLFSVAFLRTQSQVIFRAWFETVPALALLGTVGFSLAVLPATAPILEALVDESASREKLERALARTISLPSLLGWIQFATWFLCIALGTALMTGGKSGAFDEALQLGFGVLFAWGVSFYQRVLHKDIVATAADRMRARLGEAEAKQTTSLERRMLTDFGWPLLFTGMLSLFSSIALYRALGSQSSLREDFNAISALFASFAMLVLAASGIVARAARELSRPMTVLARAADRVAHGQLDAAVPPLSGAIEVVGLGESVERMRKELAHTIAALEAERAGLEEKVDARTKELRQALEELKRTQAALIQGERLATIGELVAGVAHEIVNPLNAIAGASAPLESLVEDLKRLLAAYRDAEAALPEDRRAAMERLRRDVDLDASLDDLVGISSVIQRATTRSVRIVENLKNFSRVSTEAAPADLHAGIEETLVLLSPRLKQACIQVDKRFGDLPLVTCRAGEVNQIFMNLLVNAVQALEARAPQDPSEKDSAFEAEISIATRVEDGLAVVAIADNGPGVPARVEAKIFDPFFTTKPRGQGTGLGLSISSDIARRHGGSLVLEKPEKGGARFLLRLPLRSPPPSRR